MMTPQNAQHISQIAMAVGLFIAAVGGYYSWDYGETKAEASQKSLKEQISAFEARFDEKTTEIYNALNIKPDTWIPVEMKNVPEGVTDYLLLIFKSDEGRISGKVRIKKVQKRFHLSQQPQIVLYPLL